MNRGEKRYPEALRSSALTITDLAALAGTTVRAVRYYEEIGLLAPLRSVRNARVYPPAVAALACRIVEMRRLGISLSDISNVRKGLEGACVEDLEQVLVRRLAVLDDQRAEVRSLLEHVRLGVVGPG